MVERKHRRGGPLRHQSRAYMRNQVREPADVGNRQKRTRAKGLLLFCGGTKQYQRCLHDPMRATSAAW